MNYQDATAILTDLFGITTNKQRKQLQRCRHVVLASGGTVVRVHYPGDDRAKYALSDIKPKAPGEKLSGKLKGATIFQLARWTRSIGRRVEAVSRQCVRPGVPNKVRAMLYAKKSQLSALQIGLHNEVVRRGLA